MRRSRRRGVARRWRRPSSTSLPPSSPPTTVPTLGDVDCSQRGSYASRETSIAPSRSCASSETQAPSGVERGDVLFELALTQRGTTAELEEQCNEALAVVGDDDARASRILAVRAGHHLLEADVSAALDSIREGLERAERTGDPALVAQVIAYAGQVETYHNEITPGLLERGIEIEDELGLELEWNLSPRYVLGRRLMRMGAVDDARAVLERFAAEAHDRGDEVSRADGPLVPRDGRVARRPLGGSLGARGASPTSSLSRPSTRTPSTGSGGRKRSSRPISASSTRRARRRKRPSSTLASGASCTRTSPRPCSGA